MSGAPQVSIVMPSFQQASFLEEAVRSVLGQHEVAVELIVMDPGSSDGSRALLLELQKEYGDSLKLYFVPDEGQADAIQRGMKLARGNVLAWLNSDDRLWPQSLKQAVAYLDSPEPRWLYGRCGIIDDGGRAIYRPIVWYKNLRGARFSIYKLLTEDFIPQMATFWNRAIWDKVGGIDRDRHLDMDYDLFLKYALVAEPQVLSSYLADFRVHPEAKSSTRTFEAMDEAYATARHYASQLGWRGKLAIILHRVYALRTKLIYRVIKP